MRARLLHTPGLCTRTQKPIHNPAAAQEEPARRGARRRARGGARGLPPHRRGVHLRQRARGKARRARAHTDLRADDLRAAPLCAAVLPLLLPGWPAPAGRMAWVTTPTSKTAAAQNGNKKRRRRNATQRKQVGEALALALGEGVVGRGELFVTSKLWNSDHGSARAACVKTLRDLQARARFAIWGAGAGAGEELIGGAGSLEGGGEGAEASAANATAATTAAPATTSSSTTTCKQQPVNHIKNTTTKQNTTHLLPNSSNTSTSTSSTGRTPAAPARPSTRRCPRRGPRSRRSLTRAWSSPSASPTSARRSWRRCWGARASSRRCCR